MHFEATRTRGLCIYDNGKPIAQTQDPDEIHAFALALLMGQGFIGGVKIPDQRTRFGIVQAAMGRLLDTC